jgi:hypothetical protein
MTTIELLTKHASPFFEESLAKGIPIKYLKTVQAALLFGEASEGLTGFRYMFRGKSKPGYKRPQAWCSKAGAETFAIYKRSV